MDSDAAELLVTLRGQPTWHIGSTCGPTLMRVSEEVWHSETDAVAKVIHLLVRARRTLATASERGYDSWPVGLIAERTELLQRGKLSPHLTRWLSSHVTKVWNQVRPVKAK